MLIFPPCFLQEGHNQKLIICMFFSSWTDSMRCLCLLLDLLDIIDWTNLLFCSWIELMWFFQVSIQRRDKTTNWAFVWFLVLMNGFNVVFVSNFGLLDGPGQLVKIREGTRFWLPVLFRHAGQNETEQKRTFYNRKRMFCNRKRTCVP